MLLEILSHSYTWLFTSLPRFGMFLAIIYLNKLFALYFFFSSGALIMGMIGLLTVFRISHRLSSFFFFFFLFNCMTNFRQSVFKLLILFFCMIDSVVETILNCSVLLLFSSAPGLLLVSFGFCILLNFTVV